MPPNISHKASRLALFVFVVVLVLVLVLLALLAVSLVLVREAGSETHSRVI